ncbi:hypothetical protein [Streptomyces sp. NPDC056549]|uniref:hypothetical protein n=1 Tax=Streptomyces sp. NPDC056549 TaxID=3345864 RepID=UPI0036B4DF98
MTARRTLGTGAQVPDRIRAAQADLLNELPGFRLPDLEERRDRGVLGPQPSTAPGRRRPLGVGAARTDP